MTPFSAIIPTFHRARALAKTLRHLQTCSPPPAETLVHVTVGDDDTFTLLRDEFPWVKVVSSEGLIGPGGARNVLLRACGTAWAASFDDDSHPMDQGFFSMASDAAETHPEAAVISCAIYERDGEPAPGSPPEVRFQRCIDFANGACLWRRDAFLSVRGHVPLSEAWGMEEQDVSLQLFAADLKVVFAPHLRVFHDSERRHHHEPLIASASLANIALLVFLRYPVLLWPLGALQLSRYMIWMLKNGRGGRILSGLAMIPSRCARHRGERTPYPVSTVWRYLKLKRRLQRLIHGHRTFTPDPQAAASAG